MATYKIEDVDKLVKEMENFTYKVQNRIAWGATKKGADVIRNKARANASRVDNPVTPQDIEKNIISQRASKLAKKEKQCAYRVGVVGGAKTPKKKQYAEGQDNPGGATFYWRFLEFGTEKMQAQPFLRPAIEQSATEVLNTITSEFIKRMNKELGKTK